MGKTVERVGVWFAAFVSAEVFSTALSLHKRPRCKVNNKYNDELQQRSTTMGTTPASASPSPLNFGPHVFGHSFCRVCLPQQTLEPIPPTVKYVLDDGTGLLPCTQYERNAGSGALHRGHSERHELGELLVVQGKLKRYKG